MAITTYNYRPLAIPKGRVFLAENDGAANYEQHEQYLGIVDPVQINISAALQEYFSAECGIDEAVASVEERITRNGTMEFRSVSDLAHQIFFIGDLVAMSKSAGTGVTSSVKVKLGQYSQLGVDSSFPSGTRKIASVSITGAVENTDFEVDTDLARLYWRTAAEGGGAIADGTQTTVTYNQVAATWNQIRSGRASPYEGPLRIVACNWVSGDPYDYYFPRVRVTPNGDYVAKRQGSEPVAMPCSIAILKPLDSREAVYIDGLAVAS